MSLFTFDVAVKYLLEGGKITRHSWGKDTYIDKSNDHVSIFYMMNNKTHYSHGYSFDSEDVLADDWVFVLAEEPELERVNSFEHERCVSGMVRSTRKRKV